MRRLKFNVESLPNERGKTFVRNLTRIDENTSTNSRGVIILWNRELQALGLIIGQPGAEQTGCARKITIKTKAIADCHLITGEHVDTSIIPTPNCFPMVRHIWRQD